MRFRMWDKYRDTGTWTVTGHGSIVSTTKIPRRPFPGVQSPIIRCSQASESSSSTYSKVLNKPVMIPGPVKSTPSLPYVKTGEHK